MSIEQAHGEDVSWEQARKQVLERDGYECQFCGVSDEAHREEHTNGLDVHHIIPRSDGGSDSVRNLVSLCRSCHRTMESLHAQALGEIVQKQDCTADLAGVNEVFRQFREMQQALDEAQAKFQNGHPVFAERFNLHNEGSEADPVIESSVWRDADPREISSEWEFAVSWGYKLAVAEMLGHLDGTTDVPFDIEP
jgi:hypothetical protein